MRGRRPAWFPMPEAVGLVPADRPRDRPRDRRTRARSCSSRRPGARRFSYRPGPVPDAAAADRRPGRSGAATRCAARPHVDDELRIAVKRVSDGVGSNWINDTLAVGDEIECLPPGGVFTPKSFDEDLLLFAGGSGITPVLSILKSALATGSGAGRARLRQPARERGDLRRAAARAGRGAPRPAARPALAGIGAGPAQPGAAQGVHRAVRVLHRVPLRAEPVHGDGDARAARLRRAAGAHPHRALPVAGRGPVRRCPSRPRPRPTTAATTTRLHVELDGETHEFDWPRQTKLLDFLLEQGRQGAVLVPAGRVQRLRLHPRRGRGRDAQQRDPGAGGPRRGLRARLPVACRSPTRSRSATPDASPSRPSR